ncbi:hypothetical protein CK203_088929 [Vitis vinifera]|uniref:Uncharacterized protein n=1 Tax=Vitis vinifera TaxID=29760 RepID=A0A438D0L6_VITVI|nr:hypothetical protein CK203_088929 [Vitis vinifera]
METKPLPSIREAFSEVRREESRKKVMMGSQNSALVARGSPSNTNSENRQNNGRPCAHNVVVSEDKPTSTKTNLFTKEQLEMLQQLMSQNSLSQSSNLAFGTGMLAQKGIGFEEDDWQC